MLRALPAREPSRRALREHEWALRLTGWAWRLALRTKLGVDIVGREHLAGGPRLVLVNHSHQLDPLVLALHAGRPLQFLVTEPAMFDSVRAKLLAWLGQIPKRKLESETRPMRLLKKWCELGGAAAVFPEGRFPWDGRLLPMQPGLAHLVHYLDVPVVTVRQINGDRFWPPWAPSPRRTRVRLEIDPPHRFEAGDDIDAIVADRLRVDPATCHRYPVSGSDLARGLAQLLDLCPACGERDTLDDQGDELRCLGCRSRWLVGTDNHLRSPDSDMDVGQALEQVFEHARARWTGAPTLTSRGPVEVLDATAAEWIPLAGGMLHLSSHELCVGDWRLALDEVLAHTLDWGHLMLLRTRRQRFALAMPDDSRALWTHAVDASLQHALARPAAQAKAGA